MDIHGCKGCFGGHSSRDCPCVQQDDMMQIYPAVKNSDVVVLASPLYYWTVSGQLKTALDRLFALEEGDGNRLHGGNPVKIPHSRSTVVGQGVLENETKNHRTRIVVMPQIVFDELGELFTEQALENSRTDWNGLIFQRKEKPIYPDSFSRHHKSKI